MIAIEIGPAPIQRGAEVKGRSVGRFGGGSLPRPAGRLPLAFARQCQGRHFRGQRVVQELQLLLAGVPTDTFHRQGTRLALALPENLRLKAAGAFLQRRWRLPGPTLHYRPPLGLRDRMAYQGKALQLHPLRQRKPLQRHLHHRSADAQAPPLPKRVGRGPFRQRRSV